MAGVGKNNQSSSVRGLASSDGSIYLLSDRLASLNFNGFIPRTSTEIYASDLTVGQTIFNANPISQNTSFFITKIDSVPVVVDGVNEQKYFLYFLGDENLEEPYTYGAENEDGSFSQDHLFSSYRDDTSSLSLGTDGWMITNQGNAVFSNVFVRGTIEATSGKIDGILNVGEDVNGEPLVTIGKNLFESTSFEGNSSEHSGIFLDRHNYFMGYEQIKSIPILSVVAENTTSGVTLRKAEFTLANHTLSVADKVSISGFTEDKFLELEDTFSIAEVTPNTFTVYYKNEILGTTNPITVDLKADSFGLDDIYTITQLNLVNVVSTEDTSVLKIYIDKEHTGNFQDGFPITVSSFTSPVFAEGPNYLVDSVVITAGENDPDYLLSRSLRVTAGTYTTGLGQIDSSFKNYKFKVGNDTNSMSYNSFTGALSVTGTINADSGNFTNSVTVGKENISYSVYNKKLLGNVATLTTSTFHNFVIGDEVVVSGVDATFNGTHTVTGVPTLESFTYAKTASNVASTAVSPLGTVSIGEPENGNIFVGYGDSQITITGTGDHQTSSIYSGVGSFKNPNTPFYMDASGRFSIADQLYFEGGVLTAPGISTTALSVGTVPNRIIISPTAVSGSPGLYIENTQDFINATNGNFSLGKGGVTWDTATSTLNISGILSGFINNTTAAPLIPANNMGVGLFNASNSADGVYGVGLKINQYNYWFADAGNPRIRIGSVNNYLSYQSSSDLLEVTGKINANAGRFGTFEINNFGATGTSDWNRSIINKQLTSNVATLTTSSAHPFIVGDYVTISGVGVPFDGTYTINTVPTTTTFTYNLTGTNVASAPVTPAGRAAIEKTVISLSTTGSSIIGIPGVYVDSYDSTYPTPIYKSSIGLNEFGIVFENSNTTTSSYISSDLYNFGISVDLGDGERIYPLTSASYSNPTISTTGTIGTVANENVVSVTFKELTSNIATLTTQGQHPFAIGQSVIVSGVDATFNGRYTIIDTPTENTFSYAKTETDVASTAVSPFGKAATSFNSTATISNMSSTTGLLEGDIITSTAGTGNFGTSFSVSSISANGSLVTYTSTGHTLFESSTVTITGASVAGFNGTFLVSSATANTFTVENSTTGATSTASAFSPAVVGLIVDATSIIVRSSNLITAGTVTNIKTTRATFMHDAGSNTFAVNQQYNITGVTGANNTYNQFVTITAVNNDTPPYTFTAGAPYNFTNVAGSGGSASYIANSNFIIKNFNIEFLNLSPKPEPSDLLESRDKFLVFDDIFIVQSGGSIFSEGIMSSKVSSYSILNGNGNGVEILPNDTYGVLFTPYYGGEEKGNSQFYFDGANNRWRFETPVYINSTLRAVGAIVGPNFASGNAPASSSSVGYRHIDSTTGNYAMYSSLTSASYAGIAIRVNKARVSDSTSEFILCYSNTASDLDFRVRGDGQIYSDAASIVAPADYAEYFEWFDGNTNAEDRAGIPVVLVGNKIVEATENSEEIIGIVSGRPGFIGDSAWSHWNEKYLIDDFGRRILEDYEVYEWIEVDKNGKIVELSYAFDDPKMDDINLPENYKTVIQQREKVNPNYDPELEYTPRENRQEWDAIGLVGKVRMIKGKPVNPRWRKLQDISDTVEEWFIR